MEEYLESSEFINWKTPELLSVAKNLASAKSSKEDIAQRCFIFVRDEIKHSLDYKLNPVTCKASDVLKYGTGYCYAKSHLLAALLRANNIPASLCYQRLTINGNTAPFCLHGLNAVFLEKHGWYRIDARGNNNDIDAGFCPPQEKLAFSILHKGESDLLENYSEPLPSVINTLMTYDSYIDVSNSLPDIEPT
jgi:hypothetical protein